MSFWNKGEAYESYRRRFARLAHENTTGADGVYQAAAVFYKAMMSPEGHRNYPLREPLALRKSADFLLPLGPFFDNWGRVVGSHKLLTRDDRAEVAAALLSGCKKIAGQFGYYRALAGMNEAMNGHIDDLASRMPAALRHELKDPAVRKHLGMSQQSFESGYRKKCLSLMAESKGKLLK